MNASFLKQVERVLVTGGRLHFWTDVQDYFKLGLETVATATQLQGPLPVAEDSPLAALEFRTNFERRTRMHDEPVYNAEFEKP
jgi:tRNA (guanine-N7-)-methyltransferase